MPIKAPTAHSKEKGQSLLELAFSMIFLLIILAGIVDLGRAIYTLMAMQDAAQEGILYGVAFPSQCAQIKSRVVDNLSDFDAIPITVNIMTREPAASTADTSLPGATSPCVEGSPVHVGDEMVIEVTQSFKISMPFLGSIIGQEIPLKASANGILIRGAVPPGG